MLTLKDIAAEVGVSTYTVSRVLNGMNKGVRSDASERAQKIIETAERMGYQINNSARAVSTGKTNYIGLVRPFDIRDAYLPQSLLNGISQELGRRKLYMQMMTLPSESEFDSGVVPDYFKTRLVDGILINYITHVQSVFKDLVESSWLPAVYINRKLEYDCVYQDEVLAGFKATEFLLKRRLRRIVFLDAERVGVDFHYSRIDRFEGYRRAMTEAGLEPLPFDIPRGHYDNPITSDGLETILSLYDNPAPPDGFVVPWKTHAELLFYVLTQAGKLSSLSDLNIVTFSNACDWPSMPFASIVQPEEEIGRAAVDMLVRKIENGNKALKSVVIPYRPKMYCSSCFRPSGENGEIDI